MKKIIFWVGISVLIIGLILFFLAGATGPENQPWVPSLYQTNQAIWLALALAGFVLIAISMFLKSKASRTPKSRKAKSKKKR